MEPSTKAARARRDAARRRTKLSAAPRRRNDPVTSEIDYTAEEVAFMFALDTYKRVAARPFPTCCDILAVLKSLGYSKKSPPPTVRDVGGG